jgi:hypothetical protein
MADKENLAILSLVPIADEYRTDLLSYTLTGAPAGRVAFRDSLLSVAVAPDGGWIAWDNWSALPKPLGTGSPLRIALANQGQLVRSLVFDSSFGGLLAVSSAAGQVAVIRGAGVPEPSFSLVVADGATGRVDDDLTSLIRGSPLSAAIRLGMSGSGGRLVVGSSGSLAVIDRASRTLVYEDRGRDPSLSPSGEFLAFMDEERQLVVVELSSRARRIPLGRSANVSGVGAWSPNERYLLVGLAGWRWKRLVAIDARTGQVIEVMPLGDLAGDRCVWVKRGFLSAGSPLVG